MRPTRPPSYQRFAAIFGVLLCTQLWLRANAQAPAAIGLCEAEEKVYFACQTAKSKWISICAGPDAKPQYRYGKPGAIELAYPAPTAPNDSLRYAHYFRYQTDYTEVTFVTHDAEYAVFEYSEGRRSQSGVRVMRSEEPEITIACRRRVRTHLSQLEAILPCDPDNALNLSSEGCPESAAAVRP